MGRCRLPSIMISRMRVLVLYAVQGVLSWQALRQFCLWVARTNVFIGGIRRLSLHGYLTNDDHVWCAAGVRCGTLQRRMGRFRGSKCRTRATHLE